MSVSEPRDDLACNEVRIEHAVAPAVAPQQQSSTTVTVLDRWLAEKILEHIGQPSVAILLWDGSEIAITQSIQIRVRILDRSALWLLLFDAEFYFGELYSVGRIEVQGELVQFIELATLSIKQANRKKILARLLQWLRYRLRFNSLAGSQRNIHHHYNISNDFYRLWLDQAQMQYTCAYFQEPQMSLEAAQTAKLHHICRKLQLKPGQRVVEAGCGWGGLARFMAKHYGVYVRAYNISSEQVAFARRCAEEEGLADRVEYVLDDYRNIQGQYDVFVSIGMLEHIGSEHYSGFGEVIERCLKENGRGLIHSIGRNSPDLMNAWIQKRIFPGAYPPSIKQMMNIFEPNGLSILDVENLRMHYALTLEHWLLRFQRHEQQILDMFDENFVRAWRLYLAGSIAAFTTSELQLFQIVFTREFNNDLPWSRAHLYPQD